MHDLNECEALSSLGGLPPMVGLNGWAPLAKYIPRKDKD
jgi:hypothetical protein